LERILNSWEELAIRGMGKGESIPQATLRYQKMQWGIEDDDEEEWEEEVGVKWDDVESGEGGNEADDGGKSGAGSRASAGSGSTEKVKERKSGSGSGSAKKGRYEKGGKDRRRDDDDDDEEGGGREGTFGRLRREAEGERRRSGR
jgi:hypothetical protein